MGAPPVTERPARVLIGWLDDETAVRLLRVWSTTEGEERVDERIEAAHRAVAVRDPFVDGRDALERVDVDGPHLEGLDVRLADLAGLCALQPYVFVDHAPAVSSAAPLDDLAALMLPASTTSRVDVSYDATSQRFTATSTDQNLQVLGEFSGAIPGAPAGALGLGFLVAAPPSLARVVVVAGRAFLADGYHRAVALLTAGVRTAPVVVEEASSLEGVWSAGMLDVDACSGARPATVGDFLDDTVAARTVLHHGGRVVEVRASEDDLGAPQDP